MHKNGINVLAQVAQVTERMNMLGPWDLVLATGMIEKLARQLTYMKKSVALSLACKH